jgi:hypothetical protein
MRSASPRGPRGGCYRVPQQGQLQIVIKNPNKTAVKLYLVPYSLDGMEPGTKTFVRQRSFSAGPMMEKPLTANPEAVLPDPLQHKAILRYLIHLKFCCPARDRYYLYDNIRVVFANRVPDGKESLRNEVQLPEPRYSAYRPGRDGSVGSARARLAAEKSSARKSFGLDLTHADAETMDGLTFTGPATDPRADVTRRAPSTMIPFHVPPRLRASSQISGPGAVDEQPRSNNTFGTDPDCSTTRGLEYSEIFQSDCKQAQERTATPTPGFLPSTSTRSSPVPWDALGLDLSPFGSAQLSRTVSPSSTECSEGLLSRELRSIENQQRGQSQDPT